MKPPRCRASALPVIIAMAGTKRPVIVTMNTLVTAMATSTGSAPRWVNPRTAPDDRTAMTMKIRSRPYMSARRPIRFMENSVNNPPLRKLYLSCDSVMPTLRTMNVLMNGTTRKPAVVSAAIRAKARRCVPLATTAHIRAPADSVPAVWRRWRSERGSSQTAKGTITAHRMPSSKNGQCQPRSAIHNPAGTPSADARAKALITVPIAVARRTSGIASPTMARTTPPHTPPKMPVTKRAASIEW